MIPVKREILDQQHFSLNKRPKHQEFGIHESPARFNQLDEPCPLGLRLQKTPSLVALIRMRLAQVNASRRKGNISATDKLKASHFPATLLKIGSWEYKSKYEGDLVAKCYFARHELVWEVLDGGLKNKIVIEWSHIMALNATYPEDGPGCLHVVLSRRPLFFRETNPEPRKHTSWQTTGDFTGGQASMHRHHYLQCPPGLLGQHFEKLIQCDTRLHFLSQQAEVELESPYFEPVKSLKSVFDEPYEYDVSRGRPTIFDLHTTASSSVGQCSSSLGDLHDLSGRPVEFSWEAPSPSSVMDTSAIKGIRRAGTEGLKDLSHWNQIKVPGIHPSMSMTDLVNHVENRMTEQRTSSNHPLSHVDISRCLFNDESTPSKVSSLCCRLQQKDPATFQDLEPKSDLNKDRSGSGSVDEVAVTEGTRTSRDDSFGDLLLNLPRIEPLPQFFYNF